MGNIVSYRQYKEARKSLFQDAVQELKAAMGPAQERYRELCKELGLHGQVLDFFQVMGIVTIMNAEAQEAFEEEQQKGKIIGS